MSTSTVACIVVAAGRGQRLSAGQPKAFVEVGGRTPVEHVARIVTRDTAVDHLVVVVPPEHMSPARQLLQDAGATAPTAGIHVTVVPGGATRQESVAAGLTVLQDTDEVVLVHDAARCLAPAAVYGRVIAAVRRGHRAVIPVLPVVDTIKQVTGDTVTGTVDRSGLRVVQTPQGFRRGVLLAAHEAAVQAGGETATDDAGLVERIGVPVHVVDGDDRGLKITRPFDLTVANALSGVLASSEETSA